MEFIVLLSVIVGSSVLMRFRSGVGREGRRLRSAKTYSITEFPTGSQAKVVGTLRRLDSELTAPLSGRVCVFYRVTIWVKDSALGEGWQVAMEDEDGVDFGLDDGTGRAIIDTRAAKFVTEPDHGRVSGSYERPSARVTNYLKEKPELKDALRWRRKLRYQEAALEFGDTVSIFGFGTQEPDPDAASAGYREMAATRLRMRGTARRPAVISDLPPAPGAQSLA